MRLSQILLLCLIVGACTAAAPRDPAGADPFEAAAGHADSWAAQRGYPANDYPGPALRGSPGGGGGGDGGM